jgi:methanogenic corrinoid protein MtbC1
VAAVRAWEKRYDVVSPGRTAGGQRLYSDADVARLTLLRRATLAGRGISQVANLSDGELAALLAEDEAARVARPASEGRAKVDLPDQVERTVDDAIRRAFDAVESMRGDRLEDILKSAALAIGSSAFAEKLVAPLLREIGDRWHKGAISSAQEHVASEAIRSTLAWVVQEGTGRTGRRVLIGTPAGERHELGAMLAATAAAIEGWRVTYLGSDLPAAEIANASQQVGADAVALSVVYGNGNGGWRDEVREIRRRLSSEVAIILGGEAATELGEEEGLIHVEDLAAFRLALRQLHLRVST